MKTLTPDNLTAFVEVQEPHHALALVYLTDPSRRRRPRYATNARLTAPPPYLSEHAMHLTPNELLDYASLHAVTPLEKALTQLALELQEELTYLQEQTND